MLRAITTVLLGILCLAASVPMLELALGERERTQLSCEVFDPDTVQESWLELRGCRLSWFEASYARVGQSVTEVYIPLRALSEDNQAAIDLILRSRHPDYLRFGESLIQAGSEAEARRALDSQELKFASKPLVFQGISRSVEGLSDAEARVIEELGGPLARGALIIDDATSPDLKLGIALAGLGASFLIAAGLRLRSRRRR